MPTFDPNVFDVGIFDSAFSVPFMQKAAVGRGFRRIVAGSSIPVTLHIQQGDTTPGRLFSMNPDTVQLQIYSPTGGIHLAYADMVNKSLGIYSYDHATLTLDPRGRYSGTFKMVSGPKVTLTEPMLLFEVV